MKAGLQKIWKIVCKVLKYTVPIAITCLLVGWMFHKVDFREVLDIIRHGCDFRYIFIMMALTALSYIIRGIRWGIQLRAAGIPRQSPVEESVSIFGAYALNLLFPFVGEAWRCLFMSKRSKSSLTTIVGTDLGDRISDAIVIVALIILTLIVAHPTMMKFIEHYRVGGDILHVLEDPYVWLGLAVVIGVCCLLLYWWRNIIIVKKMEGGLEKIWKGFAVLFHMKGTWLYVILTFGIWICYFLETYLCFFAFPFTRELISQPGSYYGLIPGLVAFVFGSCSVAVPSNGGLGPWNIAVMFALSLYGIPNTQGMAYTVAVWTFQTLTIIALGLFSLIYVYTTKPQNSQGM